MISVTSTMLLVLAFAVGQNANSESTFQDNFSKYAQTKMPELDYYEEYDTLRSDGKTAVIYPIFTQSAYDWKGIHDYYVGYCNSCTNATLHETYEKTYSASGNGFRILEFLGYQIIDDVDVDKNPEILQKFDKIILLHNEFVTKKEFDAISSHKKVVYLYPNSLSSQITVDYTNNQLSLVRGPNYPHSGIKNGFDWQDDNSQYAKDWDCNAWRFYQIKNGYMLNCYPETLLPHYGHDLLKTLKTL
jgi:hypothetical protein